MEEKTVMQETAADKQVHSGHRSRMRERFLQRGLDSFAEHEVLELLLFYGRTRGNTNPAAHALLEHFGTLKGVLEARPEQLKQVDGIGEESAVLLSMILPMFRRYQAEVLKEKKSITNQQEAADYCTALLAGYRTEHFYGICLDARGKILGSRLIAEGSLDEVDAYPRIVAETALNYNAHSMILCHNHPGGSLQPSQADIRVTRQLQQLLALMNISLLDHIIVGDGGACSMALQGCLTQEQHKKDHQK